MIWQKNERMNTRWIDELSEEWKNEYSMTELSGRRMKEWILDELMSCPKNERMNSRGMNDLAEDWKNEYSMNEWSGRRMKGWAGAGLLREV